MKKQRKSRVFALMAFFAMVLFCPVYAENASNYDFRLNTDSEAQQTVSVVESSFARNYELTLDMDIDNDSYNESSSTFDSSLYLPKNSVNQELLDPIITINNSYKNEVSQDGYQKNNSFTLSDGSGKWSFSGAFERKYFNQVEGDKSSSSNANLRASSIESPSADVSNPSSEATDFKTSLASSYRLEVVYSFKPTVKGKVSFTQSTIDDYDTGKSIQAEAIVEPRSDFQIKAGVKNQFENDAISNDVNSGKENKVWTEFILKF